MRPAEIARKNDLIRSTFMGGKIMMTRAVSEAANKDDILSAVRSFSVFKRDNDPHGEHDFAIFEVDGKEYFFKFDYFDNKHEHFLEDGNRVLMIGFSNEY